MGAGAGGVLLGVQDILQLLLAQAVRVQDIAELLAGQAVQAGVVGVQFAFSTARRSSLHLKGGRGIPSSAISAIRRGPLVPAGLAAVGLPLLLQDLPQGVVAFPPHVVGEGLDVPGGVGQLDHAGDDEEQVGRGVGVGRRTGSCLTMKKLRANPTIFCLVR